MPTGENQIIISGLYYIVAGQTNNIYNEKLASPSANNNQNKTGNEAYVSNALKAVDGPTTFGVTGQQFAATGIGRRAVARSTVGPVVQLIGIVTQVVIFYEFFRIVKLAVETIFFIILGRLLLLLGRRQGAQADVRVVGGILAFAAEILQAQLWAPEKYIFLLVNNRIDIV